VTATPPPDRPRDGRAVAVYNLWRLGLLAGCLALGWVAGLRGALLLFVALLVSGVLSWFLLARQRVAMGTAVEHAVDRTRRRLRARAQAEDAYVDRLMRER
jgi:Protein of unknown function (DUF4229)